MIALIHDLLDKQVRDRDGEIAGRVDGIVLALRDDKPPLVVCVEVSPITLLSRFSMRLSRWFARQDARLGPERGKPFRIPWSRISHHGPTIVMDLDVDATPIDALEDWLRVTIVERIPGS
jgi:sporulation protein YlmC with PRC-barrel domain